MRQSPEAMREWHAWRQKGIGASDAAAIAGLDPWKGPLSIWLSKTGRLREDDEVEHRLWGNLLEPAIAEEFEKRMDLVVSGRGSWREHRELSWMRATLDGFVHERSAGEDDEGLGVLEIKTVAGFKGREWADQVPEQYQLQVAHQLAVSGLQHAWLAVLFGGQRLEIYELERDDELIASLIGLEEAFWTKHVLADVPPASEGYATTTEDLRRAFAAAGGPAVDLPPDVEALIEQRAVAKEEVRAAERSCAQVEQVLMTMLGDSEVGLLGGRPRITWKRFERLSIDVAALRKQEPQLAQRFAVKSPYRRFSVVGSKEEES